MGENNLRETSKKRERKKRYLGQQFNLSTSDNIQEVSTVLGRLLLHAGHAYDQRWLKWKGSWCDFSLGSGQRVGIGEHCDHADMYWHLEVQTDGIG